jgi:hypothetical protein
VSVTALRLLILALAVAPACPAAAASAVTSAGLALRAGGTNAGGGVDARPVAPSASLGRAGGSVGQAEALGLATGPPPALRSAAGGFWFASGDAFPSLDPDGDAVPYLADNCPEAANPDQADFDGDTRGNACDDDDDADGLADSVETGTGVFVSASDTGTDPRNPDSDGDGARDRAEVALGFDPNDPGSTPRLPTLVPALSPGALAALAAALAAAGLAAMGRLGDGAAPPGAPTDSPRPGRRTRRGAATTGRAASGGSRMPAAVAGGGSSELGIRHPTGAGTRCGAPPARVRVRLVRACRASVRGRR